MHAVVLIDPKFPHNALRACAVFGASRLVWTGDRVAHPDRWTGLARLPREERMKAYKNVELGIGDHDPEHAISTSARKTARLAAPPWRSAIASCGSRRCCARR